MTAFILQTLLLLGLSYVLGCWIACLLRRMVTSSRAEVPVEAIPAGAIASAAAAGAALRQASAPVPPPEVMRQPTPAPVREAFRRADTLEPSPESVRAAATLAQSAITPQRPSQSSGSVDRFERALTGLPAAATSVSARSGATGRGPDDLKRIRKIDANLEAALHKLGVRSFAEIGVWKSADVTRVSQALGFKGRIEQENWIEQAQILATGKDTFYSSRLGAPDAIAQPVRPDHKPPGTAATPAAPPPVRPATPAPAPSMGPRAGVEGATATAAAMAAAAAAAKVVPGNAPSAAAATPPARPAPAAGAAGTTGAAAPPAGQRSAASARDDLRRIQGITPEIELLLNTHGVTRYAQIARWSERDAEHFGGLLGQPVRIQRERWVAQAQVLERNGSAAADARTPPQPAARVQAPSQSVPANPPAGPPGAVQPSATGAAPAKPAAAPNPTQPAASSVPLTKPPLSSPPPVQPPAGGPVVAKPDTPPATPPAGGAPAQSAPAQVAASSVPLTKPPLSSLPPVQPPAAGPVVPKPTEAPGPTPPAQPATPAQPVAAKPATPPATPPSAPAGSAPAQPPPAQPAASSVPLTKPPLSSLPSAQPPATGPAMAKPPPTPDPVPSTQPAAPAQTVAAKPATPMTPSSATSAAIASASVAGAAVASLAAATGAIAAKADADPKPPPASATAAPPPPPPPGGTPRDPEASPSDSEQLRGEIAHLRSVRSEGLRSTQGSADVRTGGAMDDLKRIRGIGVLIEKKLNSMGVTRYEQIAKWTSTDIDRVSHVLDFKGRIERENWVEQARILASGGQTEFSRRADRGEFSGS